MQALFVGSKKKKKAKENIFHRENVSDNGGDG